MTQFVRLRAFTRRLRRDRSGLALLEFAFTAPIVLSIGMYGIENANLALANMRTSQAALNIADNASRLGFTTSSNIQQMREYDINDVVAQVHTARWSCCCCERCVVLELVASGVVAEWSPSFKRRVCKLCHAHTVQR